MPLHYIFAYHPLILSPISNLLIILYLKARLPISKIFYLGTSAKARASLPILNLLIILYLDIVYRTFPKTHSSIRLINLFVVDN